MLTCFICIYVACICTCASPLFYNIATRTKLKVVLTGGFSCIYVELQLERQLEFYLTQLYIPNILVVMLSWVAFWIDAGAVPARVTIGVITVLTTTSQATGIVNKLPKLVRACPNVALHIDSICQKYASV